MNDLFCEKCGSTDVSAHVVRLVALYEARLCLDCRRAWDDFCLTSQAYRQLCVAEAILENRIRKQNSNLIAVERAALDVLEARQNMHCEAGIWLTLKQERQK